MNDAVIIPPRRSLTRRQRVKLFDLRRGICGICNTKIVVGEPWIDEHMNPREISGDDSIENRWPVHVDCATKKTKKDQSDIAKVYRIRAKHLGVGKRRGRSLPGGRDSDIKIKMDGTIVDRATGKPIRRGA